MKERLVSILSTSTGEAIAPGCSASVFRCIFMEVHTFLRSVEEKTQAGVYTIDPGDFLLRIPKISFTPFLVPIFSAKPVPVPDVYRVMEQLHSHVKVSVSPAAAEYFKCKIFAVLKNQPREAPESGPAIYPAEAVRTIKQEASKLCEILGVSIMLNKSSLANAKSMC